MNNKQVQSFIDAIHSRIHQHLEHEDSSYFDGRMTVYQPMYVISKSAIERDDVASLPVHIHIQLMGMRKNFLKHKDLGIGDDDVQLSLQTIEECQKLFELCMNK